ncbi:MAG: methyltransferase [Myxococcaceae bacterium]|nr:methyltransferase [Myxococcaceae bacterium]
MKQRARAPGFKAIGGLEGENPGLDAQVDPAGLVKQLALEAGQRVADIGARRGYYVRRFSDAVGPDGSVVVTDVDDDALAALAAQAAGRKNVQVRRAAPDVSGLEDGTYDLVFMSGVDHFLHDRVAYLTALKRALKPGGRIAVTHTQALKAPLAQAAREAGLVVIGGEDRPDFYLLIFRPA